MQQASITAQHAASQREPEPEKARRVMEGIARRLQLAATYNGMALRLAPHVLYTRADMLYVAAIVTERRGEPVKNVKMSVFKVDGLGELAVLAAPFSVDPAFDAADPRYAATAIFLVER